MSAGVTRTGIWKEGITKEVFPTLDHPPRDELTGGEYPERPSDNRNQYFPQLWHPDSTPSSHHLPGPETMG